MHAATPSLHGANQGTEPSSELSEHPYCELFSIFSTEKNPAII